MRNHGMHPQFPRPEYPRPERQRGFVEGEDWLNLNGPWKFRFDGDGRGSEERWFDQEDEPWMEQIIVPFCWESLAAWGEGNAAGNQNYYDTRVFRNPLDVTPENHRSAARYEIGWYRRDVKIPADGAWEGKRAILTIGAADFFTDCWCNGRPLGHHEGGYTPFEFDITDALEMAEDGSRLARVVLRVEDPMDNHEQPVGKQWQWYTTTSGIWQTVFIEPRAAAHIKVFRITPDVPEGMAHFQLELEGTSPEARVSVEIRPPEGESVTFALETSERSARGSIDLKPVRLWNNADPQLYRVKLTLEEPNAAPDVVHGYFGMRCIATASVGEVNAPSALTLNSEPIYLRGALYQSYYPDGVYTAGDSWVLRNDIAAAKEAGFDFLRIHIKIDDPLILYYADTMGILLMCDFPNFGEGGDTPKGRRWFEEMMREAINRDFNHPSIIAWCLFNETWGFGGQLELVKHLGPRKVIATDDPQEVHPPLANLGSQAWVQEIWELAKALDSTRLVEDMSVVDWSHLEYYAHGDTDINSWHFYINDYQRAKEHIEKVVTDTYEGSKFNYIEGFQQKAQPLINSEFGGVGALDGDRDVSWSFKFLTNELRRHGALSAYIYTELHDVEWEYNGFLNYDRTRKEFGYDPRIVNQGDVLPINAPPISLHPPRETVRIEVSSSHYSRRKRGQVKLHWRLHGIDSLGHHHQDLARSSVPIPFTQYRVEPAHTIELHLPSETMLCTLWVYAITAEGETVASNFVHLFVSAGHLPAREEWARGIILRLQPREWAAAEWSGETSADESTGFCFGEGNGYFEWTIAAAGLQRARRLRLLFEASSRRMGSGQTDVFRVPTLLQVSLNDVPVFEQVLPDHPHDARGALSYLRDGRGAYGYLGKATVERELLRQVQEQGKNDVLRLRWSVPRGSTANGLTIYGTDTGRYPLPPTVLMDL